MIYFHRKRTKLRNQSISLISSSDLSLIGRIQYTFILSYFCFGFQGKMEINLENAFKEAVKLSFGACIEKYLIITEISEKLCLQMISFFLKRPFLTTALFSVFIILFIIILSAAFITLVGVLVIVIVILLFEGFIFIVFVIIISMIIATVSVIVMLLVGIRYNISITQNLDYDCWYD